MGALLKDKPIDQEQEIIFHPYRLDVLNERLLRGRYEIPLRPKSLAVLRYLLERAGQLVRKEELLEAVWPESYATDVLLKGCVKEIRRALNDDPAKPRFIETAHRRGYRFIGQVARNEPVLIYRDSWEDGQEESADFRPEGLESLIEEIDRLDEERQRIRSLSGELVDIRTVLNRGRRFADAAELSEDAGEAAGDGSKDAAAGEAVQAASIVERVLKGIKSRSAAWVLTACILAVAAVAFGHFRLKRVEPFQRIQISRLPYTGNSVYAVISPDGKWVVYTSFDSGRPTLWKVSAEGGDLVQLSDKTAANPVVSPDGRLVACFYRDETDMSLSLAVIPLAGGSLKKLLNIPAVTFVNGLRWAADGSVLTYAATSGGASNIWSLPLTGGEPQQITDFKADHIYSFDWSRDGKRLVCSRGAAIRDYVLITEVK